MEQGIPMKVLIVSASIGTGHTQAARAIEEYWQQQNPNVTIKHVDFLETETMSVDHVMKETYIKMIDVFPMLYELVYRWSQGERKGGLMQTFLSWTLKSRMLKLIRQENPDAVVFTHPFPCGAACVLKRQKLIDVPLMAVVTDFAVHQFWVYKQVDRYFVGTEHMVEELERLGIESSRIEVSGIPVRRSFFNHAITSYSLPHPVKVLVMGGGLGLGSLNTALQHLDEVADIDEFYVVTGRNTALYDELQDMQASMKTKTTIYGYTSNISELMRDAALLVTKPGALTCMEAVTVGVPMVFFNAIPGQEEANAWLLEQKGCARWARDIHNLEDVVTALLINPSRLQQMSDNARAWRIDGAAHIVDAITRCVLERRVAEGEKVEDFLGNEKESNCTS